MIWYENAIPTVPLAEVALVIAGAEAPAEAGLSATICIVHPLFAVPVAA